jgi:hypothetical protein
MLLWQEYKEHDPRGYQYSQFCHLYRHWANKIDPIMRQEHRAGEKLFVDYAGQTRWPFMTFTPTKCARLKSLWPCWVPPTTLLPKPPGANRCPTGLVPTAAPLPFYRGAADRGAR